MVFRNANGRREFDRPINIRSVAHDRSSLRPVNSDPVPSPESLDSCPIPNFERLLTLAKDTREESSDVYVYTSFLMIQRLMGKICTKKTVMTACCLPSF
jgi:hypothetical protein